MTSEAAYPRVMLKLSGEAFAGQDGNPIDGKVAEFVAREIVEARELGVDVAVVVGGGNIWRGLTGAGAGMDRAQADYMGMLATVINALGAAGHARAARASPPVCRPPSTWRRWPSPTSAAGPSATSRRAGS